MSTSLRHTRRDFLRFSGGLSASILAVACVTPGADTGTDDTAGEPAVEKEQILVWDQFGEDSVGVNEIVVKFNEAHPEYHVTREAQTNMRDILKTSLDAGAGPDVMYYDTGPGFAGVLARAGLLLPLDDAYEQYAWNERILPIARERASFDGVTYGIGNELEIVGTFYNERIFDEQGLAAPDTHDDFLAVCEALKAQDIIPMAWGNQNKWPAGHTFSVFSGNIAGKDNLAAAISGELAWNEPDFVESIQIPFVDMVDAGYYNTDINAVTYDDSNLLFYSGQAAMRLTGSWMVDGYTNPDNITDPVGFFFYPSIREKVIAPPAGLGSGYFVGRDAQSPEGAFAYLNFLFSDETIGDWLEGMAMIPPVRLNADDYSISDLLRFTIIEIQQNAESMGFNIDVLTPDNYNTMMFDGFQEVIGKVKTAQEQADDLEAAMQEAIERGTVMDITP